MEIPFRIPLDFVNAQRAWEWYDPDGRFSLLKINRIGNAADGAEIQLHGFSSLKLAIAKKGTFGEGHLASQDRQFMHDFFRPDNLALE